MKVDASGLALEGTGCGAAAAKGSSETVCRVNILTNQVGYLTRGGRKLLVESNVHSLKPDFYLRDRGVQIQTVASRALR
jgi:nitrous oxidase accessory protein NosD